MPAVSDVRRLDCRLVVGGQGLVERLDGHHPEQDLAEVGGRDGRPLEQDIDVGEMDGGLPDPADRLVPAAAGQQGAGEQEDDEDACRSHPVVVVVSAVVVVVVSAPGASTPVGVHTP